MLADVFGMQVPVHRVSGHLLAMHWVPAPLSMVQSAC